eukprot:2623734-Ditylum_brightwellii.AAC.1
MDVAQGGRDPWGWLVLGWVGLVVDHFVSGGKGGLVTVESFCMGEIVMALFVFVMVAWCKEKTVGLKL